MVAKWKPVSLGALFILSTVACSGGTHSSAPIEVATTGATVPITQVTLPPQTTESATPAKVALEDATVRIATTGTYVPPEIGAASTFDGSGSGFIVDPSGLVVTNNHVVAGAAIVNVYFGSSTEAIPAKVVATSECSDLAVIDLEGDNYPSLAWADGALPTGTTVRAAGFPSGEPQFTLTEGIVSRESADGATKWASIKSLVQHDAEIYPGNSGGPLVNTSDAVVGVNVAASDRGRFAIPATVAHPIVTELAKGTDIDSIGINSLAVIDEKTNDAGVWVVSVRPGSPADKAGVLPGDLITRMNGLRIALDGTLKDYCGVIRSASGGEIPIEVKRATGTFAGAVFGDTLKPVLGVADDTRQAAEQPAAGSVVPPAGERYAEFTRIQDDSGSFAFDVPSAWADRRTSAVDFAGASRPAITAAGDVAALEAAPGTTYDAAGVAAIVFDLNSPIDQTFAVINDNAPWTSDCQATRNEPFNDGIYRGVGAVYVGCGGSNMVVSIAIERIGSDKWMLLNVFATSLADVEVAARILATVDFLEGHAPSSAPATPVEPPATTSPIVSGPSVDLPDTMSVEHRALIIEVGLPTGDAMVDGTSSINNGRSSVVNYLFRADIATVQAWTDAIPDRTGCNEHVYTSSSPANENDNVGTVNLSCEISRNHRTYTVTVRTLLLPAENQTVVQIVDLG